MKRGDGTKASSRLEDRSIMRKYFVKVFSAIVGHSHNVGVVVLVVVIKAVKEKTQSDPAVHRSVHMPCGWTLCALKSGKYCKFL